MIEYDLFSFSFSKGSGKNCPATIFPDNDYASSWLQWKSKLMTNLFFTRKIKIINVMCLFMTGSI